MYFAVLSYIVLVQTLRSTVDVHFYVDNVKIQGVYEVVECNGSSVGFTGDKAVQVEGFFGDGEEILTGLGKVVLPRPRGNHIFRKVVRNVNFTVPIQNNFLMFGGLI